MTCFRGSRPKLTHLTQHPGWGDNPKSTAFQLPNLHFFGLGMIFGKNHAQRPTCLRTKRSWLQFCSNLRWNTNMFRTFFVAGGREQKTFMETNGSPTRTSWEHLWDAFSALEKIEGLKKNARKTQKITRLKRKIIFLPPPCVGVPALSFREV